VHDAALFCSARSAVRPPRPSSDRPTPEEFPARYAEAIEILTADPTNRTGRYRIKKLEGVAPGDGQWRLRLGRFRFLYDIVGSVVELAYCGLRREDTYRKR
jgi:mRNA-degrading endonuclease RelE of RelBE toxin-antitoxin system